MISMLCPTRNRPEGLLRLVTSALETATSPEEIEIVAVVDPDDSSYVQLIEAKLSQVKWVFVDEPVVFSDLWNLAWWEASGPIYQMVADDMVVRTPAWDTLVREAFEAVPDRILFVYGYDGIQEDMGTFGFVHDAWTSTVGRFCPPYFSSDWCDVWLDEVAAKLGRRHRVEALFEHLHGNLYPEARDQTWQENNMRRDRDNPGELYKQLQGEREVEVSWLREAMWSL